MSQYPTWKYSLGKAVIVQNEGEESALVGGWYDSPADIPDTSAAVSREKLIADAEAMGIKVDKRWSDTRLAEEIAKV